MKRFTICAVFALLSVFLVPLAQAQNQPSNSVTVTVQAMPAASVISVTPTNYYQSTIATSTITVTSGGVNAACTGTWDAIPLAMVFVPASGGAPAKFTFPVTPAMTAVLGNHAIQISCPTSVLSILSPVTLPNASVGKAYSANLGTLAALSGGTPPYTFSLASGSLPTGLTLSSLGVVSGVASTGGSSNFTYLVRDSSGLGMEIRPGQILSENSSNFVVSLGTNPFRSSVR